MKLTSDSYEGVLRASSWLAKMPFEHSFRGVPHQNFIQRLIQERWLFEDPKFSSLPKITLTLFCNGWDALKTQHSLYSCLLQSATNYDVLIICRNPQRLNGIRSKMEAMLAEIPYLKAGFGERIRYAQSFMDAEQGESPGGDYLVFGRAGDIFHPSLVAAIGLGIMDSSPPVDVIFWNETHIRYDPSPRAKKFIRKPSLEHYTLYHLNYVSYDFAIRRSLVTSRPDFEEQLQVNDAHLFLLDALSDPCRTAKSIPQYLFLGDLENIRDERKRIKPFLDSYEKFFKNLGFRFEWLQGTAPYRLIPERKARQISVIIPFRNNPKSTCDSIRSVCEQHLAAPIEVILINNRSSPEAVNHILKYIEGHRSDVRSFKLVDYDLPFNHSAECNLAVKEASGDCLVFINNDAVFLSMDALRHLSAWSLMPGIGTVGARIVDHEGRLVSAGIGGHPSSAIADHPVVEESVDPDFSCYNRETWGNSFACAAISKDTFNQVGCLDEIQFPIGYNDADFNLRCRQRGLRNMYLGTIGVAHRPAGSRALSDEVHQSIMLQQRFPELSRERLFQLREESRMMHRSKAYRLAIQMLFVAAVMIRAVRSAVRNLFLRYLKLGMKERL